MDVVGLVYDVNPVLRAVMTLRHHSMMLSSQLFQEVIKNWTWKLLHCNIW